MNPESCPQLYTCSKVKMTPMIRVLLRCTAAEAMQSICTNCDNGQGEIKEPAGSSANVGRDHTYIAPSGKKLMVMVGDRSGSGEESAD